MAKEKTKEKWHFKKFMKMPIIKAAKIAMLISTVFAACFIAYCVLLLVMLFLSDDLGNCFWEWAYDLGYPIIVIVFNAAQICFSIMVFIWPLRKSMYEAFVTVWLGYGGVSGIVSALMTIGYGFVKCDWVVGLICVGAMLLFLLFHVCIWLIMYSVYIVIQEKHAADKRRATMDLKRSILAKRAAEQNAKGKK